MYTNIVIRPPLCLSNLTSVCDLKTQLCSFSTFCLLFLYSFSVYFAYISYFFHCFMNILCMLYIMSWTFSTALCCAALLVMHILVLHIFLFTCRAAHFVLQSLCCIYSYAFDFAEYFVLHSEFLSQFGITSFWHHMFL